MQLQKMSSAARETFLHKHFSETDILELKLRLSTTYHNPKCCGYSLFFLYNHWNCLYEAIPVGTQYTFYLLSLTELIQQMVNWWYFSYFRHLMQVVFWIVTAYCLGKIEKKIFKNVICWNLYPECWVLLRNKFSFWQKNGHKYWLTVFSRGLSLPRKSVIR